MHDSAPAAFRIRVDTKYAQIRAMFGKVISSVCCSRHTSGVVLFIQLSAWRQ
jgi:hypothetical protein